MNDDDDDLLCIGPWTKYQYEFYYINVQECLKGLRQNIYIFPLN